MEPVDETPDPDFRFDIVPWDDGGEDAFQILNRGDAGIWVEVIDVVVADENQAVMLGDRARIELRSISTSILTRSKLGQLHRSPKMLAEVYDGHGQQLLTDDVDAINPT